MWGDEAIEFSVFNCKIKIDFLFVAVLTFIVVTDKTFLSLCAVALIFAHEMGHIISAKILKVPINEINFGLVSIDIRKPLHYYQKSFAQKMIIILGGFICNLFIFITLSGIYIFTENKLIILMAIQSLVIGIVNILPIESLDGGEAVSLVLQKFLSHEKANKIKNILSLIFLLPISLFGIYLIIYWHNISIIFFVLYLIFERYFI